MIFSFRRLVKPGYCDLGEFVLILGPRRDLGFGDLGVRCRVGGLGRNPGNKRDNSSALDPSCVEPSVTGFSTPQHPTLLKQPPSRESQIPLKKENTLESQLELHVFKA